MIRLRYPYGYKLPYGTIHKVTCRRYRNKKFVFLRIEEEKAVIFFKGKTEKSTFTLLINPKKVIVPKEFLK